MMVAGKEIEHAIQRLSQMRLQYGNSKTSVDVITDY